MIPYEQALGEVCWRLHMTRAEVLTRRQYQQAVKARKDLMRTLIRGGWNPLGISVILRCDHTTVLHALKGGE